MLLDDPKVFAVVLSSYDKKGAFDRLDPPKVADKLINMKIRSRIVRILIDLLNDRKMQLKIDQKKSSLLDLIGGGPQDSLIGQLLYIIGSDDIAEKVNKLRFFDDLSTHEVFIDKENLIEYDFSQHVASDIKVGQHFLT